MAGLYDFVKRSPADKRFDSGRWAAASDGHLYDFAKRWAALDRAGLAVKEPPRGHPTLLLNPSLCNHQLHKAMASEPIMGFLHLRFKDSGGKLRFNELLSNNSVS